MYTFELVTLNGLKFSEEVFQVNLPTQDGQIAVFPHHMQLVSLISPGVIAIRRNQNDKDADMELFAVKSGIIEVDDKRLRVLVDEASSSDEVVAHEAEAALAHAQELAKQAPDDQSLEAALSQVTLQQSRLKIAELKNRSHRSKRA
jgi:F-type H+-transporting ATPase subunit epsilon